MGVRASMVYVIGTQSSAGLPGRSSQTQSVRSGVPGERAAY